MMRSQELFVAGNGGDKPIRAGLFVQPHQRQWDEYETVRLNGLHVIFEFANGDFPRGRLLWKRIDKHQDNSWTSLSDIVCEYRGYNGFGCDVNGQGVSIIDVKSAKFHSEIIIVSSAWGEITNVVMVD